MHRLSVEHGSVGNGCETASEIWGLRNRGRRKMTTTKITMTTDPRLAIQFATKKRAVAAAKGIGWLAKDATAIEVMGFKLWTIGDDHGGYLTRTGYAYAAQQRHLLPASGYVD